jgi:uncharacterized phage infection (PIP) family protein YhgE
LRSAGGAPDQYRQTIEDFQLLQLELNDLYADQAGIDRPEAVYRAVNSTRNILDQFMEKLQQYEPKLGSSAPDSRVHGLVKKAKWALTEQDVENFRLKIASKIISIKFILAAHQQKDWSQFKSDYEGQQRMYRFSLAQLRSKLSETQAKIEDTADSQQNIDRNLTHLRANVQALGAETRSMVQKSDEFKEETKSLKRDFATFAENTSECLGAISKSNESTNSSLRSVAGVAQEIVTFVRTFPLETLRNFQTLVSEDMARLTISSRVIAELHESKFILIDGLGREHHLTYEHFNDWTVSQLQVSIVKLSG